MNEPLVCAVMLTKDRPEMLRRAVQSFRAQTYPNKRLLIYDTGKEQDSIAELYGNETHFRCFWNAHRGMLSIGALRNEASGHADDMPNDPEILINWDDDDWSHPNRISEQVAHLQASGADVVGYNELLFRRRVQVPNVEPDLFEYEVWLYRNRNARAETSFCYWRKTWERKPFPDGPKKGPTGEYSGGEGYQWCQGLKVETVSAMCDEPRLVASIHGANTMSYDIEGMIARGSDNWKRVPAWDAYCVERMKL